MIKPTITRQGSLFVIDDGRAKVYLEPGDLFGFVRDLLVLTDCHPIIMTAVDIALDDCGKS